MDIVTYSDDDFVSPSGNSIRISRGTSTIVGSDGSKHIVPKINKAALKVLTDKKLSKGKHPVKHLVTGPSTSKLRKINPACSGSKDKKTKETEKQTDEFSSVVSDIEQGIFTQETPQAEPDKKKVKNVPKTSPENKMKLQLDEVPSNLNLITIFQLISLLTTESHVIEFLRRHRLLSSQEKFEKCDVDMKERSKSNVMDGVTWYCPRCKSTKSIRAKFFLENSLNFNSHNVSNLLMGCISTGISIITSTTNFQ